MHSTSLLLCTVSALVAVYAAGTALVSIPDSPSHVEAFDQALAVKIEARRALLRLGACLLLAGVSVLGIVAFYP